MLLMRTAARGLLRSTGKNTCLRGSRAKADSGATRELHLLATCASTAAHATRNGDLTVGFERWSRFCEEGQLDKALQALDLMRRRGSLITRDMLYLMLKKCIKQKDLVIGRRVHSLIDACGFESSSFFGNHLIRMYCSLGSLPEATRVFCKLPAPNEFVWHAIISAHTAHGRAQQAVELYKVLRESSLRLNNYLFVAVLQACASIADLGSGRLVHADVLEAMPEIDNFVGSCLIDMYSKCHSLDDARRVFDVLVRRDVVTWTAMIAGYAEHGLGREALKLYEEMQQEGMTADSLTFGSVLKACFSIGALEEARNVFENLGRKDVVSFTAMVAGYAQHGLDLEALKLFETMAQAGWAPDNVAFLTVLKVCGSIGATSEGKRIHDWILQRGLESDVTIGSMLIEMYAKCGLLAEARKVFDRMPQKDKVAWTAMINGYGQNSECAMALQCFSDMRQRGVRPDEATFTCLLSACSHVGFVNEGQEYFKIMQDEYGIIPTNEHYNCLVDLLARSGLLHEAENVLLTMPGDPTVAGWMSLLSACKTYGSIGQGRQSFDRLVQLEPKLAAGYVLMANIYADAGRWAEAAEVERFRKLVGSSKKPAKALIEIRGRMHEFTVGDMNFQEGDGGSSNLQHRLKSLSKQMKEGGHVPQLDLVLKPVSDTEKEDALCGHAEKLAIAFGLLNTPQGSTLRVVKNLRMCNDCHNGSKIISRIEGREIIVRDGYRVHHFMDGSCSCKDYH